MKFIEKRPHGEPALAARRLLEIACSVKPVNDGSISVERISMLFLRESGSADECRAALNYAILQGWLWRDEAGTYVKFTKAPKDSPEPLVTESAQSLSRQIGATAGAPTPKGPRKQQP